MFGICCGGSRLISYQLKHGPIIPIVLDKTTLDTIEYFLWYAPNIDSKQSLPITALDQSPYDRALFYLLLRTMNMDRYQDVFLMKMDTSDGKKNIDDCCDISLINPINTEIQYCSVCQKIIIALTIAKHCNENLIVNNLFRHIRNILAHGYYNIANGDYFIGFDENNSSKKTAYIKIRIDSLTAMKDLIQGLGLSTNENKTKGILLKQYFAQQDYSVSIPNADHSDSDEIQNTYYDFAEDFPKANLILKKNGIRYLLFFRDYRGRYLNEKIFKNIVNKVNERFDVMNSEAIANEIFVLILDRTYLNKSMRNQSFKLNFIILDKSDLMDIVSGKDRLQECVKLIER
jgi:hypothetical protein